MGPRIQVEPADFLQMLQREKGLVIQRQSFFQGITYVSKCGDYYYYTISKEPLSLPQECVVQHARNILL